MSDAEILQGFIEGIKLASPKPVTGKRRDHVSKMRTKVNRVFKRLAGRDVPQQAIDRLISMGFGQESIYTPRLPPPTGVPGGVCAQG